MEEDPRQRRFRLMSRLLALSAVLLALLVLGLGVAGLVLLSHDQGPHQARRFRELLRPPPRPTHSPSR